jgi:hypothetical protein
MYLQSASHLAPESIQFSTEADSLVARELFADPTQDYNILRPETMESLMILHRVTGDDIYREYGRTIMDAFEKHSKVGWLALGVRVDSDSQSILLTSALCIATGSGRLPQHCIRLVRPAGDQEWAHGELLHRRNAQVPLPSLLGRQYPAARRDCVQHGGASIPSVAIGEQHYQDSVRCGLIH